MSKIKKLDEAIYPECEKLASVHEERMTIVHFLEWLQEEGYEVGKWDGDYFGTHTKHGDALAMDYLGIDPKQLETERRAMLDEQRRLNDLTQKES